MSLGFNMEGSAAGRNEPIGLTIAARNDSSTRANKLTIQLQQEIVWKAKGSSAKQEETIASVIVPPGSELGGFHWKSSGTGNDRGLVTPVEDNGQNDLQHQLATGAGTRFQLVVPGNSLPTLQVKNVKISHSVGVVVDTACCIAEPCVWAPLCVVPTGPGPEAQPGATSLAPPQTLPNLPPQTAKDPAEPYGSVPTSPGPNDSPLSDTTYDSAQTVTYLNKPLSGMTYGSEPGFDPRVQYPIQQPMV